MKVSDIRSTWQALLLRLTVVVTVAALIGWAVGQLATMIALALGGFLCLELWYLYQLDRWLRQRRLSEPPNGFGPWTQVFDAIYARTRQSQRRRRQMTSILKEYRRATDAIPDGVILLDSKQRIRWCNPASSRLLGLDRHQDMDRPFARAVRSQEVQQWTDSDDRVSEGLLTQSPQDPSIWLQLRIFDYGNDQYMIIARDVTELQRIESMRKDFVANVSHELRTPLTVISGYLETMAWEADDEWRPIIETIEQQAARMRAIVEDLLTLSRLDSASRLEDEAPLPIAPLLSALVAEAKVLSENRHSIELHINSDLDLLGNAKDLRSAFMNLLSNAVRYTPHGGEIVVEWRERDGHAQFSVKDNGPGIAAQHIPRLTERFYRISTDRSRATGGTGLGLAIVKHILSLHGGHLEILSEPGIGSEFICYFPEDRARRGFSEAAAG